MDDTKLSIARSVPNQTARHLADELETNEVTVARLCECARRDLWPDSAFERHS